MELKMTDRQTDGAIKKKKKKKELNQTDRPTNRQTGICISRAPMELKIEIDHVPPPPIKVSSLTRSYHHPSRYPAWVECSLRVPNA